VFFSRNKNLVGLDIGSSSVKVIELKDLGKGKGYHLLNASLEPLSPEAIVDGAIMDSGLVVEASTTCCSVGNGVSLGGAVGQIPLERLLGRVAARISSVTGAGILPKFVTTPLAIG
jgi:Tfp pilus assembly PilM family ATPase